MGRDVPVATRERAARDGYGDYPSDLHSEDDNGTMVALLALEKYS